MIIETHDFVFGGVVAKNREVGNRGFLGEGRQFTVSTEIRTLTHSVASLSSVILMGVILIRENKQGACET